MHLRLHFEPSNAPSKYLGGKSPVTASSGLCARLIASVRKHGPMAPFDPVTPIILIPQCPLEPFSFHLRPKAGSAPCNLAWPRVSHQSVSPPHTPNLCAPPSSPSYSYQPGNPEFPSAVVSTTAVHRKRPACLARECLRAEEPVLEMAAPLATRKHRLVEETLRSYPSFLHCYPQESKSIRLSACEGRKNPGSST